MPAHQHKRMHSSTCVVVQRDVHAHAAHMGVAPHRVAILQQAWDVGALQWLQRLVHSNLVLEPAHIAKALGNFRKLDGHTLSVEPVKGQ